MADVFERFMDAALGTSENESRVAALRMEVVQLKDRVQYLEKELRAENERYATLKRKAQNNVDRAFNHGAAALAEKLPTGLKALVETVKREIRFSEEFGSK